MADDFSGAALAMLTVLVPPNEFRWPSTKYQADPVGFFREVLGVSLAPHQIEIVEAVRDNKRVAIASGHKIGKSLILAGLALWFYCSFPDARVVMSSTTSRQVDAILWRELRKILYNSGRCLDCKAADPDGKTIPKPCPHSAIIDGDMHELARSGFKSVDFREIFGFTAREAEAVAGISGYNVLFLVDEASGVPKEIFEAIEGNRAGGARIVLCSNPTKTEGTFYEAFDTSKINPATGRPFWKTFQISSEIVAKLGIPGLCEQEWIDEKIAEYGADSPFVLVRVRGQFVLGESGKILSLHDIVEAQKAWLDAPTAGRLHIGLDPAGPGGMGDESVFAIRRGQKILNLVARRGLSADAHLAEVLGLLKEWKGERDETPVITLDREGEVGAKVFAAFGAHLQLNPRDFVLVGVRSSEKKTNPRRLYDLVRDDLWANLRDWIKAGGSIPEDAKLAKELHAPEWSLDSHNRQKATGKPELKKLLGRSPDRADAVALAVWEQVQQIPAPEKKPVELQDQHREINPYVIDGLGDNANETDPVYGIAA